MTIKHDTGAARTHGLRVTRSRLRRTMQLAPAADVRSSVKSMQEGEWRTAMTAGCATIGLAFAGALLLELGANVRVGDLAPMGVAETAISVPASDLVQASIAFGRQATLDRRGAGQMAD
jgi:hypothetical protein